MKEAKEFTHNGKTVKIIGPPKEMPLNNIQEAHIRGEINIHEPIEAYEERWKTHFKKEGSRDIFVSAHTLPNTRKRNDLPPIYSQWKEEYRRRGKLL